MLHPQVVLNPFFSFQIQFYIFDPPCCVLLKKVGRNDKLEMDWERNEGELKGRKPLRVNVVLYLSLSFSVKRSLSLPVSPYTILRFSLSAPFCVELLLPHPTLGKMALYCIWKGNRAPSISLRHATDL